MHNIKLTLTFLIVGVFSLLSAGAQDPAPAQTVAVAPQDSVSVSQVLDRIIGREAILTQRMRTYHPLVETYLQSLDHDDELAFRPTSDKYFLGKLDFSIEMREKSLLGKPGWA